MSEEHPHDPQAEHEERKLCGEVTGHPLLRVQVVGEPVLAVTIKAKPLQGCGDE